MHPRQASLLNQASELIEKTAAEPAKPKPGSAPILWKYTDPESNVFYLEVKKMTVKSPFSGKSFTTRPERHTPQQVGKEMKEERAKQASESDRWKA